MLLLLAGLFFKYSVKEVERERERARDGDRNWIGGGSGGVRGRKVIPAGSLVTQLGSVSGIPGGISGES